MCYKKVLIAVFLLFGFTSYSQNWLTNIDGAKQVAQDENKKIVLVFSGSDWCAPCMKLENEIWKSEKFIAFSKENYILLKADFPRRKKNALSKEQQEHNNALAESYNKMGYFPFVVVMDAHGKVLGELGYQKVSPQEYINVLESF